MLHSIRHAGVLYKCPDFKPCVLMSSSGAVLAVEAGKAVPQRLGLHQHRLVSGAVSQAVGPLHKSLDDATSTLATLQRHLESVLVTQRRIEQQLAQRSDITTVAAIVLVQLVIHWLVRVWSS